MSTRVPSPFPVQGLSEVVSYQDQPALTSRDIENMRGISPLDGRVKGAKRAGFTKWSTLEVNSGGSGAKIQFLNSVITDDRLITYAKIADADLPNSTDWEIETPGTNDCTGVAVDARGVIYILDGESQWVQIAPDTGDVIYKRSIPSVSGTARAIAVDTNYDVYVGTSEDGVQSDARLWRFRAEPNGTYTLAWEKEVKIGLITSYIADIKIVDDTLYVIANEGSGPDSECHVFTQYRTSIAPTAAVSFATEHQALGVAVNAGGEIIVSATGGGTAPAADQWLAKYDSQGTEIWKISSTQTTTHDPGPYPTVGGYHPGGIGFSCAVNSEGDIYTVGNPSDGTNQDAHFCKIVDDGDQPNMDNTAGTYWEQAISSSLYWTSAYRSIAVDKFDNVYYASDIDDATYGHQILAYAKDGALGVATNIVTYPEASVSTNDRDRGLGVALPPAGDTPEYPAAFTDDRAEFVYIAKQTNALPSDDLNLEKLRLVEATSSSGSPRNITVLAAADGDIFRVSSGVGGGTAPAGSPTLSKPELETAPQLIQTASAFNKLFIVDGVNSVYYDAVEDTVSRWGATDAGRLPPRCKLLTVWRGRVMLSGDPDNANAWHASKAGDPFGWEVLPKVITQTQAMTSGLTDGPGEVPDIINALIPYNRDFLLFGCDHHLFMLRGDPAAGGQLELVSDVTGTSLGTPWTKDPQGVLYFFGSKGGVYRWVPGGMPDRISEMSIDRQLFDLDLGAYHIAMEWSHREDGIRIVQVPFGAGGAEAKSYFWERKTGGWHVDSYDDTDHQPTAIMSVDGDLGADRVILYGCEDGFIRYVDELGSDDDGEKIDGRVLYGPYFDPEGHNLAVDVFRVELDRAGSGCRFEWYATDSVDDPLDAPTWSGDLKAGQNSWRRGEARGPYLWLRLVNATAGQHFGIEGVDIRVVTSGLVEAS